MDSNDIFFMQKALVEAKKSLEKDEVPIGSILVYQNKIISKGHNQVELLKDATAHAEMLCLSSAYSFFNGWRLQDTVLYTTLEPCIMCSGAIILSRIKRLVIGASDARVGGAGSYVDVFSDHPIHKVEIKRGILEKECGELLKNFFKRKRAISFLDE